MSTIDIDTGGTFTDGFFTHKGEFKTAKVLTTPHDLTVCLADCIKEGARQFGLSPQELLAGTDVLRYSSTIGVNTLITRAGSKIGLLVSRGYKETLYAPDPKEAEPLFDYVSRDMILEVGEEVDDQGRVVKALDREEVIGNMQVLIDRGARAIAVSLRNSHINPANEKEIKKIIKEQYPSFYLGSVRVFLASEVSEQPGAFARTNAVALNGYIHDSLVKYLYKAEDDLKDDHYQHPLMVSHSHGGVARVAKTRAIDTFSSGPTLGLVGAGMVGQHYGLRNILTADMGGTSLDLGLIRDGKHPFSLTSTISGLPVSVPMINTYSAPVASGSIAGLDGAKNLRIGPRSAGAKPGPACFDLGGMEPTLTDADVVLGFVDPDYFLGGRVKLNRERARSAIEMKIARPLGIDVEQAAHLIKDTAEREIGKVIAAFLEREAADIADPADIALMAYGGAGPTHCCGFAAGLRVHRILASPFSSVFSAFGSSMTDLLHTYARYVSINLFENGHYLPEIDRFNTPVEECMAMAGRDIEGEGFAAKEALYSLDLIGGDELAGVRVILQDPLVRSHGDIEKICEELTQAANSRPAKVTVATIILNAVVKMPHFEVKPSLLSSEDPGQALKGYREIFWSPETGRSKTAIFDREKLMPGNTVPGPAVVEARDTTYVIPGGRSLHIDEYANVLIKEA